MNAASPFLASFLVHALVLGAIHFAPAPPEARGVTGERLANLVRFDATPEDDVRDRFVDIVLEEAVAEVQQGGGEDAPQAIEEPEALAAAEAPVEVIELPPERRVRRERQREPVDEPAPAEPPAEVASAPVDVEALTPSDEGDIAALDAGTNAEAVTPSGGEPTDAGIVEGGSATVAAAEPVLPGGTGRGVPGRGEGDRPGDERGHSIDADALYAGYAQTIHRRVQRNRSYPRVAQRAGIQGTVLLEVRVDEQGRILSIDVLRSSGHSVLDRAAIASIESLGALDPPPRELPWDRRPIEIPIHYAL